MATQRITMRLLAGWVFTLSLLAGTASAQVRVEDVLSRRPAQPNVNVTTPTGVELSTTKAEQVAWPAPAGGTAPKGIVVKDAGGKLVRQFIDTKGGTSYNIFSYYLDGVEAYREIDSNGNGKPDQFRWLGSNGGKWGADPSETGTISTWYVLSPEELSQELFFSLVTKDRTRIAALLPTEADLKKLNLPAAEIDTILKRAANVNAKFMQLAETLKLSEEARWVHLELGVPHTTPADSFGGRDDLVKHKSGTVLLDKGDGKSPELFQTGELVLIGRVWKMIDGPSIGGTSSGSNENVTQIPKEIEAEVAKLSKIPSPQSQAEMAKYHVERAIVLEEIVRKTQAAQQTLWLRQLIEAYAAAGESNPEDAAPMQRLKVWRDQIVSTQGAADMASYVTFRMTAAEYSIRLAKASGSGDEAMKVQTWWREQLETFANTYPNSAEAPESLLRLAVANEFAGKDGEAAAKKTYEKLAKTYSTHPHANKAMGALKRLNAEGQAFELSGTTINGKAFTEADLVGNITLVMYWASWGRDADKELKLLAELQKTYAEKGVQILTISVDDQVQTAVQMLQTVQMPGIHLHAAGGLDGSPLAAAYGIQMIPHLMLVDKTGKVIDANAQNGPALKDEIEKLLK